MFCPNCGTQNDDSAAACQKCAFNLKGAAAPRFKGTMLMVNAPPTAPRAAPGTSAKPPAPGAAAPAPAAAPATAPAPRPAQKPLMKATMIGVAPPSAGGVAPPAHAPAPVPAPTPAPVAGPAFVAPPVSPEGGTAVIAQANVGPAASAASSAVNPLGGTMVATPGAMGYGAGPQPQAVPPGGQFPPFAVAPAPVAQPTPIGQAPQTPFGATTPSGYAPGEFASGSQLQPQQFHQSQPGGGWGAPAGIQQSPPGAYAPYGAVPAQALQPMGAGGGGGYAMPLAVGQHGPVGKMRNPVMVVVLTYVTCGIYGLIALLSMLGELKAFRQKNDISPILFLLPVVGLLEMIKLPAKVLDAKRMAGVPNAQEPNVILYLFLGIYMLPADLNEIWQVASAKQGYGALPPGST